MVLNLPRNHFYHLHFYESLTKKKSIFMKVLYAEKENEEAKK